MLTHVQSGQPFEPSASRTNAFVDVALWFQQRQNRDSIGEGITTPDDFVPIQIENKTGGDVEQWGILKVGDVSITVADDLEDFKETLIFQGVAPTDDAADCHVIMTTQTSADEIGLAILYGVATVQINVTDAGHTHANTIAADTTKLESEATGPFFILWKESGTGIKWAKVISKGASTCADMKQFPIDTLTEDTDYFIGLKSDGQGGFNCVRVVAKECP